MTAWLLPENVEDVLPPQACRMEDMRRALLDLYRSRGYQLVIPPLMEYVESLLTGVGADLDLKTFKLVDLLSGRLMGVRADITPQVARIDAHLLAANAVNRLCYAGSVLHTQSDGFHRSREPIQIGAELYGEAGVAAERPGRGPRQHVDLAALQRRQPVLRGERDVLRLLLVVEDHRGQRPADIDVEAAPLPLRIRQREAGDTVAGAADQAAALLDPLQRRLGESRSSHGGAQPDAGEHARHLADG